LQNNIESWVWLIMKQWKLSGDIISNDFKGSMRR